ncbi:hypothetical protein VTK73DRAFT_8197 [Phialemonium thermophilum]|uniref:Uncharacterized protein n=1 Tax=Phialemonium thermophilum TaxID=223376 RepID=A0ABR3XR65_9PEZI
MPGLQASRWAPKPGDPNYYSAFADRPARWSASDATTTPAPTTTPAGAGVTTPAANAERTALDELTRYTKIVRRLKWKLPYLADGYRKAVDRVGVDPALVAEAELMFKLDFFEYYMLLERALVHLLGVFSIRVGSGPSSCDNEKSKGSSNGSSGHRSSSPSPYRHRYHANVLEALDRHENPLYPILGIGEVRRQLSRAKDLRNRWKNADGAAPNNRIHSRHAPPPAAPLESYDLEGILSSIFAGFDRAFVVAEQFALGQKRVVSDERTGGGDMDMHDPINWTITEEEQWEFMVDAMDWEAV